MGAKSSEDNVTEGLSPLAVIAAFCAANKQSSVTNKIWLWYTLAVKSVENVLTEEEAQEFALFLDQLNNLVAAVYNYHQANGAAFVVKEEENND